MQIAHRDRFPFTDLSLLMGIREKGFNWLAAKISAECIHTHTHSLGAAGRRNGITLNPEVTATDPASEWQKVFIVCANVHVIFFLKTTFSPLRRFLPFQRHVVERADLWCSAESKKSISPSAVWLIISLVYNGAYANPTTCPHTRHMQMGASSVFIRQILETERKSGVESSLCQNSHGGDSAPLV